MGKVFGISLTLAMIVSMPFVCLLMIVLVATVNWHDVLLVCVVIVVQVQIRFMRREDWKIERALRRVEARRMLNDVLADERDAA